MTRERAQRRHTAEDLILPRFYQKSHRVLAESVSETNVPVSFLRVFAI